MTGIEELLNQVDAFIRKYYKNLMIRGFLLFVLIFLVSYFLVVGLEYIGKFNTTIRAVLFFSFIGINLYVAVRYLFVPLSKLFSFGERINRYQAASIIGRFFPDVNDRLLNTLQLNDTMQASNQYANIELIKASVRQNSNKLSVFSFPSAIDYKENSRYLKYIFPVLLTFALIGLTVPSLFQEGTKRLVNYNEVFPDIAPFDFVLVNEHLKGEEGESFELIVQVKPKPDGSIPDKVYIQSSEGYLLMTKLGKSTFTYTFPKLRGNLFFSFMGGGFTSMEYEIDVAGKTSIGQLTAELKFPEYLQRTSERIENVGDLTVPEGTTVIWSGVAKNTKQIRFILPDSIYTFSREGFKLNRRFLSNQDFYILLYNKFIDKQDTLFHRVEVIKDQFPSIIVEEIMDSTSMKRRVFSGYVSDDHGLRMVTFTYELKNKLGVKESKSVQVPGVSGTTASFSMNFDLDRLPLELEDEVVYFFTVYDNDGVNGSKSMRSSTYRYKVPSSTELNDKRNEEKEKSIDELNELRRETQEFNERFEQLKKEMLNTRNASWKEKQQVEQLREQRNSLEQRLEQLKENMKSSFEEKSNLSPVEEALLEKQEMLDKLLEELMDDELRDLLDQLQKMLEDQNKDGLNELFEEMDMKAEDMERQLDRTMEMLKRFDVEERMEDIQNALEKLAVKQEELKDAIEKGMDKETAVEEQIKLNEEFEKIEDQLDKALEKNDELKRPMNLDELYEDREEIKESMNEAKDALQKNKQQKAGEKQEGAAAKMKQMAEQVNDMMSDSKQKQKGEDIEALTRLLKNLIELSLAQEENMLNFSNTSTTNPNWGKYGKAQRSIMDNTRPVEDSLRALADRIPMISTFINTELSVIGLNFTHIPDDIDERQKRELGIKQQYVMTSFNNLALMLNESLEQMQKDMNNMMPGSGSCDNPGGKGSGEGEEDMQGIKEMLKKQLEQMEKGSQPDGNKPGDQPGQKQGLLPMNAKQAAQMAAQQAEMRRKIEELKKELNKDGKGTGNHLNELIKELEDQQKDLINKKWDTDLIRRQKEILTRLLESEKAMEERGFDEERESKSGKDEKLGNQIEFLEYKKQKEKQIELLRTLDPTFNKYYRDRANEYYNRIYK
jgi:hypothetical protein